jgi:hypothetical protein
MFLIGEIGSRILQWSVSIGGALVAVFLIFSIVKDAIGYSKGSGSNSIGKILGKIVVFILMIGLVIMAGTRSFDNLGKRLGTQGVGVVEDTASDLTGK